MFNGRPTEPRCATPAALLAAGLVPPERLGELEHVAARYAVSLTPDVVALIDPADPHDPIARQFVPDAAELEARAGGARRSDRRRRAHAGRRHRASLSRPRAAQARACLPGLLPVLLSPRDGRPGPPAVAVARRARDGARLHPRASGDLGGHPHRRRSADPVAAPAARGHARARRDRARQDRARAHARAGGGAGPRSRRARARAQGCRARRPTWCCTPTIRAS